MSDVTEGAIPIRPGLEGVPGVGAGEAEAGMTIDELARRTAMTVRNIRAHQSRGLLAPPVVRGRTGYYGAEHVARIELIRELQADGFNLEAIRRLIEGAPGSSREVLDFTRAVKAPFEEEEPEIITAAELANRWGPGEVPDPALTQKAEKLGLLRHVGDGRFEIFSPRLQHAGTELARLGVPPERALEVVAKVRRNAQSIARTFTELFMREVWQPFDEAGRPEERWPEVRATLERLRPLASEATLAIFQLTMSEVTEEAFGRVLKQEARGSSEQGKGSGRRKKGRRR